MEHKKKILLFIDSIGYGGAQKQFVCLCNLLKEAGFDVKVLVIYDEFDFYKPFLKGVDIICDLASKNIFLRLFRIPLLIKKKKADVVISYLDTQCILACLARLICRFKLIVSERNTTQKIGYRERIKFLLYRKADYIVPNSYSQGRFISDNYKHLSGKVNVITNTIDQDTFSPSKIKTQREVPEVISVGRNLYQKNYLGMVECVKILVKRGVKAHFSWYAGVNGTDDYHNKVIKKIEEYGLNDVITIKEPTNRIADCYRESDFFWLASFYEGFPNVLCEAMMCGLPVACGNVCDNADIVKEEENGFLFDPHNPEEMADQLQRMISLTHEERKAVAVNNVRRITELCSEDVFIEKYIKLIEDKQ